MPYTVNFLDSEGIVTVVNSGVLEYKDYSEQAREAHELSLTKDSYLFLADCTKMVNNADLFEILDLPGLYERIKVSRSIKVAVLLSEDAATNEDIRFYETVCLNRGWNVKVFSNQDSALVWLKGQKNFKT